MNALCLQHVSFEGPGVFAEILAGFGYELACRLVPEQGVPGILPDFLLVMGGPMSANDSDAWIEDELRFIRKAVDAGIPVLGICLGSQLMAKALGGSVYKGSEAEIGIKRIRLTEAGREDAVFGSLPQSFDVFEWHGEGITLPPGVPPLAESERFPVQAFRAGPRGMGLLFHLEIEPSGIASLCKQCPGDVARSNRTAAELRDEGHALLPTLHRWARLVVRGLTAKDRPVGNAQPPVL